MLGKTLTTILTCLMICLSASAQKSLTKMCQPLADSLSVLLEQRTSVKSPLSLRMVTKRDNSLDFYFKRSLADYPWRKEDIPWLRNVIKTLFPSSCSSYSLGRVYSDKVPVESLITPGLGYDGKPRESKYAVEDQKGKYLPIVRRVGAQQFDKGLSHRHIALFQSHGRYYEESTERWEWQRIQSFTICEDVFTPSFVLPFLIPMLENAGAYVMTPRERDTQVREVVTDNDPYFARTKIADDGLLRRNGVYTEKGRWEDAGVGFADDKIVYTNVDNPFRLGTARKAEVVKNKGKYSEIEWAATIEKRGEYAVYVSYKSFENSTESAHYTVHHAGGKSDFYVNQKMGGGTWIYLGTFEFDTKGSVTLTNEAPEGEKFEKGSVVSADAVRFGGGMGKIARGPEGEESVSGMPAYIEGALYSLQWAGMDTSIIAHHKTEYTNDFASRGPWVSYMSGGSFMNPDEEGCGIPFDLSFAWHSDAGRRGNDSIVGLLSIYTSAAEGKTVYPAGGSRMAGREYADIVQTQVISDLRAQFDSSYTRRMLWDRNYSESRTPSCPSMLLELLSHQNFADMRLGLDPNFRFAAARAVYKGMLKFLSNRYGFEYEVQPLPVKSFAVVPGAEGTAVLSWEEVVDSLEITSRPKGYVVYTRIDDGAFDQGVVVGRLPEVDGRVRTEVAIEPGHIYSYKIRAYNDGGLSFPSEVLSIGSASGSFEKAVLVVNNFDRIAGPSWFDSEKYAGFVTKLDEGVDYMNNISFIGEQYQFRKELPWEEDDNPGFGGSFDNQSGKLIPGNSFDYVAGHGRAIMKTGYAFYSASALAFAADSTLSEGTKIMDMICGKQVSTSFGRGLCPDKYQVFPLPLQKALRRFTKSGGNVLISGSNIATDVWDRVYPAIDFDKEYRDSTKAFVQEVLGYKWQSSFASTTGCLKPYKSPLPSFAIHNTVNEDIYCVANPDAIYPYGKASSVILRYEDTNLSAAVRFKAEGYKVISFGFPLEVIKDKRSFDSIIKYCIKQFE